MLRTLVWLFPASRVKNRALRILGDRVDSSARLSSSLVLGRTRFIVGRGVVVGRFNLFRGLRRVELGEGAFVGPLNSFSAYGPLIAGRPMRGKLRMARGAKIISRHYFDCSGSVLVGEFSSVAGHGTRFLSHSTNLRTNRLDAREIVIGDRSFVGSYSILLGGVHFPRRSVLAAGSVMHRCDGLQSGLWAGNPATFMRPYEGAWFDRLGTHTLELG